MHAGTVLRVWAVGCHRLVADYLACVLASESEMEVRWILGPNECFGERLEPDVVVLDACDQETPVQQMIRSISGSYRGAKYLVLGRRGNTLEVCRLLSFGAKGFVSYEQVTPSLASAIRAVHQGGTWVDSYILRRYGRLREGDIKDLAAAAGRDVLTSREEEIVHLVRQRFSNKEISSMLALKVSTVKFHLSHIFLKLQAAGRSDLWSNSNSLVPSTAICRERIIGDINCGSDSIDGGCGLRMSHR